MTLTEQRPVPIRIALWLKRGSHQPTWLDDFVRVMRTMVRDELRAGRDQISFAAASPWLNQSEAQAYLKMSRTTLFERRTARKLARTAEAKAEAFAPEYGSGPGLRFRREELDSWLARQRSDEA